MMLVVNGLDIPVRAYKHKAVAGQPVFVGAPQDTGGNRRLRCLGNFL